MTLIRCESTLLDILLVAFFLQVSNPLLATLLKLLRTLLKVLQIELADGYILLGLLKLVLRNQQRRSVVCCHALYQSLVSFLEVCFALDLLILFIVREDLIFLVHLLILLIVRNPFDQCHIEGTVVFGVEQRLTLRGLEMTCAVQPSSKPACTPTALV